ncbi:MAG: hypothetical protein MJZ60_02655 [Bacteroidaceae bacterium]|nr:hypothetical protein [Bacteroidaceae bacterium]
MRKFLFIILIATGLPIYAEWRWIGDTNGDKALTIADVDELMKMIMGISEVPKDITLIDTNGDKKVGLCDVTTLIDMLLNPAKRKKVWVPEMIPVDDEKGSFDVKQEMSFEEPLDSLPISQVKN